jgi:hypothetical protein
VGFIPSAEIVLKLSKRWGLGGFAKTKDVRISMKI